jgi:hypothetical protein
MQHAPRAPRARKWIEPAPRDPDEHALAVSAALRYLQTHLQRVMHGQADAAEMARVAEMVREIRAAEGR